MKFYGRKEEISEIQSALEKDGFSAILIYGRRRVGKTELVNYVLDSYRGNVIRFECKRAGLKTNLISMSKEISKLYGLPESFVFSSFDELFEYVFEKSKNEKVVLFIDEFSFLLESDSTIDSSLAIAINKYKRNSKIKLIISGSLVKIMMQVVEANAPLYGRFTNIFKITPFDYYTSAYFYPDYSDEDKVLMYAVFGGVPYFNSLIDNKKSAKSNILELVVKRDSIIEHEINEVIMMETSKISDMNEVINVIGKGISKYSDILKQLTMTEGPKPAYLLNKLQEMDIIEKISPINDKNNKKKSFYAFKDNMFNFYFRYIFDNLSSRNIMNPNDFYEEFIKDDLQEYYLPEKFESISKEFLIRKNINGQIKPIIKEIGTYFFNDSKEKISRQFDVVTEDKLGYISYECKFRNSKLGNYIVKEEEQQVKDLNIDFYKLGFFSKSGFTEDIDREKYNIFELKDFYVDGL